jgi:hypothetical protein
MGTEPRRQTSDYLDYDMALNKGIKLLKTDKKKFKLGFLIVVGINVGLRISDILKLRHKDMEGDTIKLHEKKQASSEKSRLTSTSRTPMKSTRPRSESTTRTISCSCQRLRRCTQCGISIGN